MSAEYQDVNKKFTLGDTITDEQKKFYETYGFVHFKKVFDEATIMKMREEIATAAERLVQDRVEQVKGVPVKYGYNSENKIVPQRTPFMNILSPFVNEIVTSDRLKVLLEFIPNSRFAFEERDGVVINHYVNAKKSKFKRLGWHNDSLRDLFYFEKVRPMLNVGIGLFPSSKTLGGLRLIPGTHKQSVFKMMFGKWHVIDGRPDPREIPVEVEIGDLTLHDGRMWHRAQAPTQKLSYERKSFYFPIICGPHRPKNENSSQPFYLRFFSGIDIKKATEEANEQSKA